MTNDERRLGIMRILRESGRAVTGSSLSEQFGVTRQVIVADIAILRARNEPIVATTQGYVLVASETAVKRTVACRHGATEDELRQELYTIVDAGGTVLDVTVEHPVYGEMTGTLRLSSRQEIDGFLARLTQARAEPLLVLTGGLHLHTIQTRDEAAMQHVLQALNVGGYLEKA